MNEKDAVLKREAVLLGALILCAVVFRILFFNMPLDPNEGSIAAAARVMDSGGVLYKDVFDPNPPFAVHLYRLAFELSGYTDSALRGFSAGFFAFVLILLYITARTLWGRSTAVFACLIYTFAQNNQALYGLNASAEFFGHFPALLVFLFVFDADEEYAKVNFFLAGFFASVAALCWYGYAFLFFPVITAALAYPAKGKGVINALMSLAGFALMYLLAAGWSVKQGNTAGFTDTMAYTLALIKSLGWQGFKTVFASNTVMFLSALPLTLPALFYGFFRKEPDTGKSITAVLSFSLLAVFYHVFLLKGTEIRYYIPLIPAAALLGGVMMSALFSFAADKTRNPMAAGIICIAVLGAACVYPFMKADPERYAKSGGYTSPLNHTVRNAAVLTGFKKAKGDTLLAWPDMAQAYFYAGINPVRRHISANTYRFFEEESAEILPLILDGNYTYIILRSGPAASFMEPVIKEGYEAAGEEAGVVTYRKTVNN